jgi:hypothetical protein
MLSGRDWVFVLLGAAAAGAVTLVVLSSRAAASPGAAPVESARPAARLPVAAAADGAARPQWTAANRARWTGAARKSAAFDIAAENRIQVWTRQVQPTLVVRCTAGALEVFVVTESAAKIEPDTEDHTVRYSLDGDAEVTERWADSMDHDALFVGDGAAFADRLLRARRLRFSFTPHNAAPADVHFSVDGLGALIEPAAAECGLPPAAAARPSAPTPASRQGSSRPR